MVLKAKTEEPLSSYTETFNLADENPTEKLQQIMI